jgi:hypothetical protein
MRLRFEKALAVLLLMASMAFMPNAVLAEEAEVTELPSNPELIPEPEEDAVGTNAPKIRYSIMADGGFKINIDGIQADEIEDFTWDGTSIGKLIASLQEDGTVEIHGSEYGTEIVVKIEASTISNSDSPSVFGVVLASGTTISKAVVFAEDSRVDPATLLAGAGIITAALTTYYGNKEDVFYVSGKIMHKGKSCSYLWCSDVYYDYDVNRYGGYFAVKAKDNFHQWKWVQSDGKTLGDERYQVPLIKQEDYHYGVKVEDYCGPLQIYVYARRSYGGYKWRYIQTGDPWFCKPFDNDDGINIIIP